MPVFFPCQRTKQLGGEHRHRAWPPPAWLPPSSMRLETPRHPWPLSHSPWNPSRSPSVPIPPLLSLPPATERSPSPPTSARAATAIPKPLRHALELRRSSLVLLVVSRDQKGPEQPPSSSSSSFGLGALLRRFGHSGAPPSPLTLPTAPR